MPYFDKMNNIFRVKPTSTYKDCCKFYEIIYHVGALVNPNTYMKYICKVQNKVSWNT
jgi:hypothetical protein